MLHFRVKYFELINHNSHKHSKTSGMCQRQLIVRFNGQKRSGDEANLQTFNIPTILLKACTFSDLSFNVISNLNKEPYLSPKFVNFFALSCNNKEKKMIYKTIPDPRPIFFSLHFKWLHF